MKTAIPLRALASVLLTGTLYAASPAINSSDYVIFDFWNGFFGKSQSEGGSGQSDGLSIETTAVNVDILGNFTLSSSDLVVERRIAETLVDHTVAGDQDFTYENAFIPSTLNVSGSDSGTSSVSEYGHIVLNGADAYHAWTGPSANVAIRFEQVSEPEAEHLVLGYGVRKPTGLSNSSLTGTFVSYCVQRGFVRMPEAPNETDLSFVERSEFTFNGAGGVSESYNATGFTRTIGEQHSDVGSTSDHDTVKKTTLQVLNSTPIVGVDPGTYSLTSDGMVTMTIDGESSGVQLGADLNTAAFGARDSGSILFGFGVRQGSGMTNSDVVGEYTVFDWEYCVSGTHPEGVWGKDEDITVTRAYATLALDGTFRLRLDEWSIRRTLENETSYNNPPGEPDDNDTVIMNKFTIVKDSKGPQFVNGTYTLSPTGQLNLQYTADGEKVSIAGQSSSDGLTFVYGGTVCDVTAQKAAANFGIGIRRPGPQAPLFVNEFGMKADGFHMRLHAPVGVSVEILGTENLNEWNVLQSLKPTGELTDLIDTTALEATSRFYIPVYAPW